MNNATIDDRCIVLNRKQDKTSGFDSQANVLIRNLPKETDQKELNNLFKSYGNIKSCKLEVYANGESRGFGYVQFETQEAAQQAITKLHNSKVGEKNIEVMIHAKKNDREDQGDRYTNLYVQNLPEQGFSMQDL